MGLAPLTGLCGWVVEEQAWERLSSLGEFGDEAAGAVEAVARGVPRPGHSVLGAEEIPAAGERGEERLYSHLCSPSRRRPGHLLGGAEGVRGARHGLRAEGRPGVGVPRLPRGGGRPRRCPLAARHVPGGGAGPGGRLGLARVRRLLAGRRGDRGRALHALQRDIHAAGRRSQLRRVSVQWPAPGPLRCRFLYDLRAHTPPPSAQFGEWTRVETDGCECVYTRQVATRITLEGSPSLSRGCRSLGARRLERGERPESGRGPGPATATRGSSEGPVDPTVTRKRQLKNVCVVYTVCTYTPAPVPSTVPSTREARLPVFAPCRDWLGGGSRLACNRSRLELGPWCLDRARGGRRARRALRRLRGRPTARGDPGREFRSPTATVSRPYLRVISFERCATGNEAQIYSWYRKTHAHATRKQRQQSSQRRTHVTVKSTRRQAVTR